MSLIQNAIRSALPDRSASLDAAEAHAVAEAEIGVGLRDRPALDVVAVEQPRVGPAAQHEGQLPGEVVRVLHAGVQAEAAGRRKAVGGSRRPGTPGPCGTSPRPACSCARPSG